MPRGQPGPGVDLHVLPPLSTTTGWGLKKRLWRERTQLCLRLAGVWCSSSSQVKARVVASASAAGVNAPQAAPRPFLPQVSLQQGLRESGWEQGPAPASLGPAPGGAVQGSGGVAGSGRGLARPGAASPEQKNTERKNPAAHHHRLLLERGGREGRLQTWGFTGGWGSPQVPREGRRRVGVPEQPPAWPCSPPAPLPGCRSLDLRPAVPWGWGLRLLPRQQTRGGRAAAGRQQALAVFSSCRNSAPWAGHFFPLLSLSLFGDFPHSAFDLPPVFAQSIGSDGVRG